MPKPTKPPVRAKRPRAEVQEEFSTIREDVESAKRTAEPKRDELLRQQEADARAAVGCGDRRTARGVGGGVGTNRARAQGTGRESQETAPAGNG